MWNLLDLGVPIKSVVNDELTGLAVRTVLGWSGYSESPPPEWLELFEAVGVPVERYASVRYSGLLLLEAEATLASTSGQSNDEPIKRVMAVTAGSAYSHLPKDWLEPQFGKGVILNWTTTEGLVAMDIDNPGRRGKRTSQKLHNPGTVSDFALFDDLYNVLRLGSKVQTDLGEEDISGGRSVRFKGSASVTELVQICDELLLRFMDETKRPIEFAGIEPVQPVFDEALQEDALEIFFSELSAGESIDLGFLEPKEAEENQAYCLRYKNSVDDTRFVYTEITDWRTSQMSTFLLSHLTNYARKRSAEIALCDIDKRDDKTIFKARGSEPLCAHISFVSSAHDGKTKWLISEGSFYRISAELHARLTERVQSLKPSNIALPNFDRTVDILQTTVGDVLSEGKYNERVCTIFNTDYTNFDKGDARKQIDRSRVEVCDIFIDGLMACVKREAMSTSVAAVCRQIIDAAVWLEAYSEYWLFLKDKLSKDYNFSPIDSPHQFTFVLTLITNDHVPNLGVLPLKAKLAITQCMREVFSRRFGLEFKIVNYV